MLTAEERILLHLLAFVRRAEGFEVPFAMSQSGVALACGVRRSHASAMLTEMEGRGLVTTRLGHLEGGGRRRKVYVLTPSGAQAAEVLRQRIAATPVRIRMTGGEENGTLAKAMALAPRGSSLLDLALAATDGIVDFAREPPGRPPADASPRRFYGRVEDLAAARSFLRSGAVCLAIRGLPGMGKTALLARLAESSDAPIVWVRVSEWSTPQLVVSAIAAKLQSSGRAIDPLNLGGIDEAIARISREAATLPFVALIDDVHKASEDVVRVLSSLLPALRGTKGKLVIAGRRIPAFYSRREVALDGLVHELELTGLDEASASKLVTDRGVPSDRRAEVVTMTKGHPLFLELFAASGGRGIGNVRAYIREEVAAKLTPREEEMLAALSVHRQPVSLDAVAQEVPDLGLLEGLGDRSLVRLGDGLADLHDLLREFFYSRLTAAQRLRLHAAAASYYEARADAVSRVELVYHTVRAGKSQEAAQILGGVGRALVAQGLPDDVLRLVAMLDLSALDAADRIPLLLLRGDILSMRGDWRGAQGDFDEAGALAEDLGDVRGHARAVFELGALEYRRGDFAAAKSRYERALELVGTADETVVARILNALGILEWQAGDFAAAADLYSRSKAAYERAGDLAGVAGAINNLGILRWQQEDVEGALAHYADALRLSEELGDHRTVAILYNNIGEAYRRKGDAANAAKFYERSLALSETLGFLWQVGEVHRNLGKLFSDGRGTAHLERALAIFDALGARRDRDEVERLLRPRSGAPVR